jgi:hypothetical protein
VLDERGVFVHLSRHAVTPMLSAPTRPAQKDVGQERPEQTPRARSADGGHCGQGPSQSDSATTRRPGGGRWLRIAASATSRLSGHS